MKHTLDEGLGLPERVLDGEGRVVAGAAWALWALGALRCQGNPFLKAEGEGVSAYLEARRTSVRGHGDPRCEKSDLALAALAGDVTAVIDALGVQGVCDAGAVGEVFSRDVSLASEGTLALEVSGAGGGAFASLDWASVRIRESAFVVSDTEALGAQSRDWPGGSRVVEVVKANGIWSLRFGLVTFGDEVAWGIFGSAPAPWTVVVENLTERAMEARGDVLRRLFGLWDLSFANRDFGGLVRALNDDEPALCFFAQVDAAELASDADSLGSRAPGVGVEDAPSLVDKDRDRAFYEVVEADDAPADDEGDRAARDAAVAEAYGRARERVSQALVASPEADAGDGQDEARESKLRHLRENVEEYDATEATSMPVVDGEAGEVSEEAVI